MEAWGVRQLQEELDRKTAIQLELRQAGVDNDILEDQARQVRLAQAVNDGFRDTGVISRRQLLNGWRPEWLPPPGIEDLSDEESSTRALDAMAKYMHYHHTQNSSLDSQEACDRANMQLFSMLLDNIAEWKDTICSLPLPERAQRRELLEQIAEWKRAYVPVQFGRTQHT